MRPDIRWIVRALFSIRDAISLYIIPPLGVKSAPKDKNSTITLSNSQDEKYVIDINANARTLTAHRTAATGKTSFNGSFSIPSMQAPLNIEGETVTIDMFVDQSSVEILTKDGTMSMTNLVFPQSLYNSLTIIGATYEAQIRTLNRIW